MESLLTIIENKNYIKDHLKIFKVCNIGNKLLPYKNNKRYLKIIVKDTLNMLKIIIDNDILSFETMITNLIYQSKDINNISVFYDYFNTASYVKNEKHYYYPENNMLLINSIKVDINNFLILSTEYYYYIQLLLNHDKKELCHMLMYAIFLISILIFFNIDDENIDNLYIIFFGKYNMETIEHNIKYYNYKSLHKLNVLECINILNGVTLTYDNYKELLKNSEEIILNFNF